MVGIPDVRRKGLDKGLEMGIDKHGDTLSGGVLGRNNAVNRIAGFMDFWKTVGCEDQGYEGERYLVCSDYFDRPWLSMRDYYYYSKNMNNDNINAFL